MCRPAAGPRTLRPAAPSGDAAAAPDAAPPEGCPSERAPRTRWRSACWQGVRSAPPPPPGPPGGTAPAAPLPLTGLRAAGSNTTAWDLEPQGASEREIDR